MAQLQNMTKQLTYTTIITIAVSFCCPRLTPKNKLGMYTWKTDILYNVYM